MRTQDYSIVVAAHGSRDPRALEEVEALVALMKARSPQRTITHGYLEFARPTIDEGVRSALEAGTRPIVMLPALLLAATHAKNDMPGELALLKREFPSVDFHFGAPMDLHPALLRLGQQRITEAEARSDRVIKRAGTCLVVVGRGTSDPDANSEVCKLARMLQEGLGFGHSYVCYAGTAEPVVGEGLRSAARLGCARIVVFPYFLFDGRLVKRIYAAADELAARQPGIEVLKAGYLGPHDEVAEVFLERAREGLEGRAAMNCSLCKYRVQIVGFEEQVGQAQRPHHLAVRGRAPGPPAAPEPPRPYEPHPIEAESFRIIEAGRDWSGWAGGERRGGPAPAGGRHQPPGRGGAPRIGMLIADERVIDVGEAARRARQRLPFDASDMLSLTGSALGLAVGALTLKVIPVFYAYTPISQAYRAVTQFDPIAVLWALALAALSTFVAGLYPAWRVGRAAPAAYLKSQ